MFEKSCFNCEMNLAWANKNGFANCGIYKRLNISQDTLPEQARELPTPKGMSFGENSPLFFPASFCHCFLGHEVVHPQEGSPQA